MLDTTIIPTPEDDGSPRMVTLFRGGKEVMAVLAEDPRDAAIEACKIILDKKELKVGDEVRVSRI